MPSCVNSSNSVVDEQQARMDPYICGMKPSRLYVKAHQQSDVIPIIRAVEMKTGYEAVTTWKTIVSVKQSSIEE